MTFEESLENVPLNIFLKFVARELDKRREPVLKYQTLDPNVLDPNYAKPGDMCFDIFSASEGEEKDTYIEYKTGLRFEIPEGYDMLIFPRSSISNYDLMLANSVGVIDNKYRGEVLVRFKKVGQGTKIYSKGDKICQGILIPKVNCVLDRVLYVSTDTDRAEGGFGSTGK